MQLYQTRPTLKRPFEGYDVGPSRTPSKQSIFGSLLEYIHLIAPPEIVTVCPGNVVSDMYQSATRVFSYHSSMLCLHWRDLTTLAMSSGAPIPPKGVHLRPNVTVNGTESNVISPRSICKSILGRGLCNL
jgi:hypothetical protein